MKVVVTGADGLFGPWFAQMVDTVWVPGKGQIIGLLDNGRGPIAACYYESFNGASVMMHCAGEGKDWLNREFLWYSFHYPFAELGVEVILSPVESTNLTCRKFIEHLGFSLEATLKNAAPKGDILIYSLNRVDCKWLNLKGRYRGQAQST